MDIIRRRSMIIPDGGIAITSDDAIPGTGVATANGMIVTPITMPSGNRVTIEGLFPALNSRDYYKKFADFTGVTQGSLSYLQISTTKRYAYATYGNNWVVTASSFPANERATKVVIDSNAHSLYVYGENGTDTVNNSDSSRWKARTSPFRVFLSAGFYVTRVTQEDASGTIIHELVPKEVDGRACLMDTVDRACYFSEGDTAYLARL